MEKNIRIYQVKSEFVRDYGFRSYKEIVRQFGEKQIRHDVYDLVYEAKVYRVPSLDQIFLDFNINKPEDYNARCLSCSDLVELPDDGGLWYCDSIGWKRVEWKGE